MVVHKALANEEFAVSIFGPTFGRKGSIKKVQGRHNVVRLLVQASMIQLIGKYLGLPYWKLLDGAMADKVVLGRLTKRFYRMTEQEKVLSAQEWLFLHGHNVNPTGKLDAQTKKALKKYKEFDPSKTSIDLDTFLRLYIDIPCNAKTLGRREKFARLHIEQPSLTAHTADPAQKYVKSQKEAAAPPVKAEQRAVAAPPERAVTVTKRKTEQKNTVRGNSGIGRMLSDDEW